MRVKIKNPKSPNHSIRTHQHVRRDRQANLLRGLEVDYELKLHRLLHRQVGGLSAFQNLVYVSRAAASQIGSADTVSHKTSSFHRFANLIHYRNAIFYR